MHTTYYTAGTILATGETESQTRPKCLLLENLASSGGPQPWHCSHHLALLPSFLKYIFGTLKISLALLKNVLVQTRFA